jgi:hypothetical protein
VEATKSSRAAKRSGLVKATLGHHVLPPKHVLCFEGRGCYNLHLNTLTTEMVVCLQSKGPLDVNAMRYLGLRGSW